jgi:aspartyl-tRNA(Asn)/glutamyl-tRNA(Gln) amidotransferase subunit B
MEQYELSEYDADVLTSSAGLADYFEQAVGGASKASPKTIANWVQGKVIAALNEDGLDVTESRVTPDVLGGLVDKIADGTLSGKLANDVFDALRAGEGTVDAIIEQRGLKQITDSAAIEQLVADVLAGHAEQTQQFRDGNEKVLGFLVGQVMKASQGKANPQQVNEILRRLLAQ